MISSLYFAANPHQTNILKIETGKQFSDIYLRDSPLLPFHHYKKGALLVRQAWTVLLPAPYLDEQEGERTNQGLEQESWLVRGWPLTQGEQRSLLFHSACKVGQKNWGLPSDWFRGGLLFSPASYGPRW